MTRVALAGPLVMLAVLGACTSSEQPATSDAAGTGGSSRDSGAGGNVVSMGGTSAGGVSAGGASANGGANGGSSGGGPVASGGANGGGASSSGGSVGTG